MYTTSPPYTANSANSLQGTGHGFFCGQAEAPDTTKTATTARIATIKADFSSSFLIKIIMIHYDKLLFEETVVK